MANYVKWNPCGHEYTISDVTEWLSIPLCIHVYDKGALGASSSANTLELMLIYRNRIFMLLMTKEDLKK